MSDRDHTLRIGWIRENLLLRNELKNIDLDQLDPVTLSGIYANAIGNLGQLWSVCPESNA